MNRNEKGQVVDEFRQTLSQAQVAIATHYRGLTVAQMTDLRARFRKNGAEYRVIKNTLAKIAAQGTGYEGLGELLSGPTGIVTSADPVAPAKVVLEFAKKNPNLVVRGAVLNGRLIDVQGIEALASLPSREVLLGQLMRAMMGPVQGVVGVLSALPGGLVRSLEQIRKQKEEAGQ